MGSCQWNVRHRAVTWPTHIWHLCNHYGESSFPRKLLHIYHTMSGRGRAHEMCHIVIQVIFNIRSTAIFHEISLVGHFEWRHLIENCYRNQPRHDDDIKWNHFPRYLPFVRGIRRWPQRPVKRSFDVFYDLRLNKRLSKQSWGWWSETPSRSLWRHCNANTNFCSRRCACWLTCTVICENICMHCDDQIRILYIYMYEREGSTYMN